MEKDVFLYKIIMNQFYYFTFFVEVNSYEYIIVLERTLSCIDIDYLNLITSYK